MSTRLLLLLVAAILTAGEADHLDALLLRLGLERAQVRPDPALIAGKLIGTGRLPMVEAWLAEPLRIPAWQRSLREVLLDGRGAAVTTLAVLGGTIQLRTWRTINDPPPLARWKRLAEADDGLARAVRELDPQAQPPDAAALDPGLRRAATILLACAADLAAWRELALRQLTAAERTQLFDELVAPLDPLDGGPGATDGESARPAALLAANRTQDLIERVDLIAFAAGADDLAQALAAAEAELAKVPAGAAGTWACATALGAIRLGSPGDDVYEAQPWLLIIDAGGADRYAGAGATVAATQPVGICLDLAGNDRHEAAAGRPASGAGTLGWGVLIDLAGDDAYTAAGFFAQGAGVLGVGWLDDRTGTDAYRAAGAAQGYGHYGIGWLADRAGDDRYDCITYAQGCGRTRGVGLLLDLAGNDRYVADDEKIVTPSAQSDKHNSSCAQGAGFGDRRDLLDGRSLPGGVGMLLDGAGNDTYHAGVFAQAVGYWHGIGILDDRAGDDSYRGVWYAQSATAHFGVSFLADGGGDDRYDSAMCMAVAAAHDLGASVFVDEGGNDLYTGGATCGLALNQGVALFADLAGDDGYRAGSFGGTRVDQPVRTRPGATIGLFLDLGGRDTYAGTVAGDGREWLQPAAERQAGGGSDVAGSVRWSD